MLRISLIWFITVMSSPLLVGYYEDVWRVAGWMAIGEYNFDLYDGFLRSFYFYAMTLPSILVCFIFRPGRVSSSFSGLKLPIVIRPLVLILIMGFYLIAFYFQLGMNGVETYAPFKLSGIVYYLRAYILFLVAAGYILQNKEPSVLLVVMYAIVAGGTSASRFIAVLPLILLLVRHLLSSNGRLGAKGLFLIGSVALMYMFITVFRIPFYEDGFELSEYWTRITFILDGGYEVLFEQGFLQLFMRLGIGRDVILAYEVAQNSSCTSLKGLLFGVSSCANSPLDFYGLSLQSDKFYLGNPQLSSLITLTTNPIYALTYSLLYAFTVAIILILVKSIKTIKYAGILQAPIYLLILIFVLVGPILYAWYLAGAVVILAVLNVLFSVMVEKNITLQNNQNL